MDQQFSVRAATRSKRLIAQILDAIIGAFIAGVFAIVSWGVLIFILREASGLVAVTIFYIFYLGYLIFADGLQGGQSYAKKLLNIKVVSEKNFQDCTYLNSFKRNFLLMFLGLFDWVFIFGMKRKRLGDYWAGTIVIDC